MVPLSTVDSRLQLSRLQFSFSNYLSRFTPSLCSRRLLDRGIITMLLWAFVACFWLLGIGAVFVRSFLDTGRIDPLCS